MFLLHLSEETNVNIRALCHGVSGLSWVARPDAGKEIAS